MRLIATLILVLAATTFGAKAKIPMTVEIKPDPYIKQVMLKVGDQDISQTFSHYFSFEFKNTDKKRSITHVKVRLTAKRLRRKVPVFERDVTLKLEGVDPGRWEAGTWCIAEWVNHDASGKVTGDTSLLSLMSLKCGEAKIREEGKKQFTHILHEYEHDVSFEAEVIGGRYYVPPKKKTK